MRVVVALDGPRAASVAQGLEREGIEVAAVVPAAGVAEAAAAYAYDGAFRPESQGDVLADIDALLIDARRESLTAAVVALCDRRGVRIIAFATDAAGLRLARALGIADPLPADIEPWRIGEIVAAASVQAPAEAAEARDAGTVIVVWGAAGAPGRSTIAVELAVELARGGRHVALIDADTHAPSLALALGLADEGPGFAAACRHAGMGVLDAAELERISVPLVHGDGQVDALPGLNRPSRWPELTEARVEAALAACREWADFTVVDVGSSLERDEEIMSDLEAPRRNAATIAALRAADAVVAVAAADPLGISRFVRAYPDLRALTGSAPVSVLANRLRPGALGIDSRGQIRRTLERFAGIQDVAFLPLDPRSADAAMLQARPIAEVVPRSPLIAALRRFVGEVLAPVPPASAARAPRRRAPRRDG